MKEGPIEQPFFDEKIRIGFVYFHNDYDNYITYYTDPFTWVSTYENLNKAKTEGFEVELSLNPLENFFVSANYTHTDTRDESNGGALLRRPEDKYSVVIDYDYQQKLHANLSVNYVGKRLDWQGFAGEDIDGERYTRVDLTGSYTLNEYIRLYAKIENLLDEEYQEIRGYDAPGISAFGGIKLSF